MGGSEHTPPGSKTVSRGAGGPKGPTWLQRAMQLHPSADTAHTIVSDFLLLPDEACTFMVAIHALSDLHARLDYKQEHLGPCIRHNHLHGSRESRNQDRSSSPWHLVQVARHRSLRGGCVADVEQIPHEMVVLPEGDLDLRDACFRSYQTESCLVLLNARSQSRKDCYDQQRRNSGEVRPQSTLCRREERAAEWLKAPIRR
ncbi:hypothetical protein BAUCODRAFT_295513 [Baudoinia panamericana UAMH 10762]|uniref:Uncharacterized protein n=1 Tax=Baudoinia panamericana (strain UAMH 10762) TaxID=717646 RepID=M2LEW6_BAUPA|nr:uncharacterized protein BAUCODRAFT_295513 [Baudoinia panamericana UAMH 10762]EMC92552.1 hypothetical protein BAUCODRAFT_295513 [Baudoinia panamericana UAMH 10762]